MLATPRGLARDVETTKGLAKQDGWFNQRPGDARPPSQRRTAAFNINNKV